MSSSKKIQPAISANCASQSETDVLVKVENVSKKFCRSLKRSLWYGIQDIASELNPFLPRLGTSPLSITGRSSPTQTPPNLRPDEFWAVRDVSFEIRRGECLGLIGHNGAGKTTLLKMLNGLIKPDHGQIQMRGRVGALIALGAGFNPILTGRENIYVNAAILGMSRREIGSKLDEIVSFAEIGEFIDMPVQNYSSGMQVRLGFAVAGALKPDILLLDEVLAVGDVSFQVKCFNKLSDMRRTGVPFILVSHNMHHISRYCNTVVFMKNGRIEYAGKTEEGIGRFLNSMNESSQLSSRAPDWSSVNGSGRILLKSARFLSSSGIPITRIHPGEQVGLEVSFECNGELVNNPIFDVVIRCRGEFVFQATNHSCNQSFGAMPSRGKIILWFDYLPFNGGPLVFSFCILDSQSNELFDWKRDLLLEVLPDSSQAGSIRIGTKWEVLQDQAVVSPST